MSQLHYSDRDIPPHAKKVFHGVVFDIYQWKQEMFDGSTQTFERVKRADTATIIPVVGDKILILEQEQPGTPAFLCFPGGQRDDDEDPLDTAKRELLEETGYSSNDWEFLQSETPSTRMIWTLYTYIARDCVQTDTQHLDAGEKITTHLISFEDMLLLTENNRFREKQIIPYLYSCRVHAEAAERFKQLLWHSDL